MTMILRATHQAIHPAGRILMIFLATRLGLVIVNALGRELLPSPHVGPPGLLYGWTNWDSWFYITIATEGYQYIQGQQSNLAFYPLYPLLIRATTLIVSDAPLAGWMISQVASLLGMMAVYCLLERKIGSQSAMRSTYLMAVFPYSLFFGAVYAESLFLLLVALTFMCAESRWWLLAGVAAALASACRATGVILTLALLILLLGQVVTLSRQTGIGNAGNYFMRNVIGIIIAPGGAIAFATYQYLRFGDPFLNYRLSLTAWGTYSPFADGWERLTPANYTVFNADIIHAMNFVAGIVFLALAVPVARRLGLAYGAFTTISILIALPTQIVSLGRYVSVLFPVFGAIGCISNPLVYWSVFVVSAVLMSLFTILYGNGYPMY